MSTGSRVKTLEEKSFASDALPSDRPVLVDFWAPWCPPCRAIAPVVEELADEFEGVADIGKVNVDENPSLAQRYDIRSIPTLLFLRDGEIVDRVQGVVSKEVLRAKLAALAEVGTETGS